MIGSSSSPIPVDFMPGPSSALTDSEQLNQLVEMFPNSSEGDLRVALTTHGTVSRAALSLSNSMVDAIDGDSDSELGESVFLPKDTKTDQVPSLTSLLERLQKKMSNEKEKLKIDEEDLLNDALAFYKDSDFDASKKLRVIYNNQPAADTGGVTRQFFTQLLRQISDEFFEGDGYKRPIYNSQVVASGMMKLCGTIIVHSILQGGPGLPIFSPSVYYYLATGDSDAAIKRMTVNDCSLRVQSYINEVISAVDISTVNEEETMNILSECGLTMPLTNNNKVDVMKSIIVHDSIGKPKIVLDQLREGLHTLGFGDEMKKYPDIFQPLFVFAEADLKGMLVVDVLRFPECMNSDETNTRNFLTAYLSEAGQETLENFLVFTTGAPSLPNFGLGSIEVKFDEVPSIFASTCLQEVTFPRTFPDEATFTSALDAVVNTVAKSFNCV